MKRTFHRNGLAIALLSCQLPGVLFAQQGATYTDIAASARSPIGQGRLNEAATESVRPIQLDRSRREAWAMVGIAYGKRTNPEDCRHEVPFLQGALWRAPAANKPAAQKPLRDCSAPEQGTPIKMPDELDTTPVMFAADSIEIAHYFDSDSI